MRFQEASRAHFHAPNEATTSYLDTLLKVNTAKAMELLKLPIIQQKAYIYFNCPALPGITERQFRAQVTSK